MAKAKKAAAKKTATESTKGNALDRAIAQIEKQYGSGSIMKMDESKHRKIDGIPTGALSLDIALGGSGIPRGRVVFLKFSKHSFRIFFLRLIVLSSVRFLQLKSLIKLNLLRKLIH